MNTTYEWLYENYAQDLQKEFEASEEEAIERLAHIIPLTDNYRLNLVDCLADLRYHCGVESFALGVQLGLRLTSDFWAELPESTAS